MYFDMITLKPKYPEKVKLCYTDTDSFIIHIKTEYFYKDIVNGVAKWFGTSNYDKMIKKVIGIFKDELGRKNIIEFAEIRAKTYAYLMDNDSEHKKTKRTKKSIIK